MSSVENFVFELVTSACVVFDVAALVVLILKSFGTVLVVWWSVETLCIDVVVSFVSSIFSVENVESAVVVRDVEST